MVQEVGDVVRRHVGRVVLLPDLPKEAIDQWRLLDIAERSHDTSRALLVGVNDGCLAEDMERANSHSKLVDRVELAEQMLEDERAVRIGGAEGLDLLSDLDREWEGGADVRVAGAGLVEGDLRGLQLGGGLGRSLLQRVRLRSERLVRLKQLGGPARCLSSCRKQTVDVMSHQ